MSFNKKKYKVPYRYLCRFCIYTVIFVLFFCLQVTNCINISLRSAAELEVNIVSVERIKEYSDIDSEVVISWESLQQNIDHYFVRWGF